MNAGRIARVWVDISRAHLDRTFDYLVPDSADADAVPGARVRVRFAGRLLDGFIAARSDTSDHTGRLTPLSRVISAEPVLTPPVAALCRAVADRYAGTMADVLRLAVPPRHARAESEVESEPDTDTDTEPGAEAGPEPDTEPDADTEPDSDTEPGAEAGPEPDSDTEPGAEAGPEPDSDTGPDGKTASTTGTRGGAAAVPDAQHDPGDDRAGTHVIGQGWARYGTAASFLDAVAAGRAPRAVWQALPGEDWPARFAEAAATAWRAGRGALLLVPDARELARLETALAATLPEGTFTTLAAELGRAERYRRFLRISRGWVRIVAGTRAAAFAPVRGLGLVALFDDGNDLYAEPRAPYPHTRQVLMLRSTHEGAALLLGGFARTAEGQLLVGSGWAGDIVADRTTVRTVMPHIEAAGDDYAIGADSAAARARLTPAAFAAARQSLADGRPVLLQVPRRGYLPALACADCRHPARCRRCDGPLSLGPGARLPSCRWCGRGEARLVCPVCGSTRVRATVIGAARTAEEIGSAFPGAVLRTSSGDKVLDAVPAAPAIVVATPGAEPPADGGYGAALLLDGAMMLGRPDLRAAEETLRRWMAAAALVVPAADGGRVVVGADAGLATVQALVRWDPIGHAQTELASRKELALPPTTAMVSLEGSETAVGAALAELVLPDGAEVLGPVPLPGAAPDHGGADPQVRALLRTPTSARAGLLAALTTLAAARSMRKNEPAVRIQVDPVQLG